MFCCISWLSRQKTRLPAPRTLESPSIQALTCWWCFSHTHTHHGVLVVRVFHASDPLSIHAKPLASSCGLKFHSDVRAHVELRCRSCFSMNEYLPSSPFSLPSPPPSSPPSPSLSLVLWCVYKTRAVGEPAQITSICLPSHGDEWIQSARAFSAPALSFYMTVTGGVHRSEEHVD